MLKPEQLARVTRSGFAPPLAVALAVVALVFSEIGYRAAVFYDAARDRAIERRVAVNQVRRLLLEAESSQRGYLLTSELKDKEPYLASIGDLGKAIAQLAALPAERDEQRERVTALADLASRKLSEMQEVIRLAEAGERQRALDLMLTGIGREQMAAIDKLVQDTSTEEGAAVVAASRQLERVLLWSRVGIALLVLLGLAAVLLGLRQTRLRWREREAQQRALQAERDKLEVQVAARTRALTEIAMHLQTVREDERSRLARELHDELGGLLTAAKLDVARIKSKAAPLSPELAERIRHLVNTLDAGIALKRRIIEDLRPSSLSNLGLKPALEILCSEFAQRSEIAVDARLDEVPLDEPRALSVYRLVQEALTNVAKYAGARRVEVSLAVRGDRVHVCVRDDGRGFDAEAAAGAGHGLAGMRFRVQSAGGEMSVRSSPGAGTVIEAELPVG